LAPGGQPAAGILQTYDELTPTLKAKNKVILANFADEINALYQ
jgi:long-subunit acyl-CoA synthetase (AMP-forming)